MFEASFANGAGISDRVGADHSRCDDVNEEWVRTEYGVYEFVFWQLPVGLEESASVRARKLKRIMTCHFI